MSFNSSNSPCTFDNASNSLVLENRFCKKKKFRLGKMSILIMAKLIVPFQMLVLEQTQNSWNMQ